MIILKLSEHLPKRATEWLLSGIVLTWGATVLLIDPAIWESPQYWGVRQIAGKLEWGAFAAFLGFLRLAALFVNGTMQRSPHLRLLGAAFSIFLWLNLSLALVQGPMLDISMGFYPWMLAAELFNVYRASQDARISDWQAENSISPKGTGRDATSTEC